MIKQVINFAFLLMLFSLIAACTSTPSENVEPETTPVLETAVPEPTPTITSTPKPTATAVPEPIEIENVTAVNLDEPFSLGGGETVRLADDDLQLTFAEVLEDSRCPKNVECFWSGQAIITIVVEQSGQPALELGFNTNPVPDQTIDALSAYGYTVHLEQLDPYPVEPEPIPFADYQAQLMVTRP